MATEPTTKLKRKRQVRLADFEIARPVGIGPDGYLITLPIVRTRDGRVVSTSTGATVIAGQPHTP